MEHIVIYGRGSCSQTAAAESFCTTRGFRYEIRDTNTPALANELEARTGKAVRNQALPQVFLGERHIGDRWDLQRAGGDLQQIFGGF